ncbi:MAG: inositol monophosphatase family protein [Moorellaceae bacterium]
MSSNWITSKENPIENLTRKLKAAEEAALKAGKYIIEALGQANYFETKTSVTDLVTEIDRRSEALIKEVLKESFPEDRMWGEEGGIEEPESPIRAQADLWLIDPLDGTTNFVHGLPFFSVSLALQRDGEVVLGVVYDPLRQEKFYALKGWGCWLNEKRVQVSVQNTLRESLVCTGFPYKGSLIEKSSQSIQRAAPKVRDVRSLGSAALELAYVACGRLTAYWEWGLAPWDVAAGKILVEEAGGCVTTCSGEPFALDSPSILATNGRIHTDIVRLLSEVPDSL